MSSQVAEDALLSLFVTRKEIVDGIAFDGEWIISTKTDGPATDAALLSQRTTGQCLRLKRLFWHGCLSNIAFPRTYVSPVLLP